MSEDIEKRLEDCEIKKKEYFSGWQREKADFINYKNKEGERNARLVDLVKEDIFLELLPILDNFNLAEKAIVQKDKNTEGLLLIKKQLEDFLKSEGLEEIGCNEFDPCVHEAVEEVESEKEGITELEKGYIYNGRVIRPSKVRINKHKNI